MKSPDDIKNALISRVVTVTTGQSQTLYRVDLPQDSRWQFVFQETGNLVGTANLQIKYRSRIAELESQVSVGRFGGEIITGFGSVQIDANCLFGSVELKSFFTTQSLTIDSGAFQIQKTQQVSGNYENLTDVYQGWTPFPFNQFCVYSNNNFTIRLLDIEDNVVFQKVSTDDEYKIECVVPPHLYAQIKNTVADQKYTIVYTRKD